MAAGPFAERIGLPDDACEREADRIADAVVRGNLLRPRGVGWAAAAGADDTIQRTCAECEEEDEREQIRRAPRDSAPALDAPAAPIEDSPAALAESPGSLERARPDGREDAAAMQSDVAAGLLVEDDSDAGRGQMRKAEFMRALRAAVCASVDAALSGTGRGSDGCPWIDHWLGYYESRSASQIERSLRRYAPDARGVTVAAGYVPLVAARVRRSADTFAATGEVTGAPDDMPAGAMAGGGVLASFGGMFFKARPGGPARANPVSIRAELGDGQSLPGSVRARMESAFGTSFDRVRLHDDANAAQLSDRLNARAFTIGEHVAFGSGEFRPGTIAGDALIAHELAHVVQQGHGAPARGPLYKSGHTDSALEQDADTAAAGAVAAVWTGARGRLADVGRQAMPRMRSGLQLQRCGRSPKGAEAPKQAKLSVREERDASIQTAGEQLREVNQWAQTEVKRQNVPSVSGVKKLEPKQAENVSSAIKLLERAESLFESKGLDALPPKLTEIVNQAKEARKYSGSSDQLHVMQSRAALNRAVAEATTASEIVTKLKTAFDVSELESHVNAIAEALNGIQAGQDMFDGVESVVKHEKACRTAIAKLRERFDKTPQAIRRIIFVLRSFLALNAPGLTTPPTEAEIKAFRGTLRGSLSADFSTVFGEGKVTTGFAVFEAYADVLDLQLTTRAKMEEAGVKPHSPIPTQGDVEAYFTALASKPNPEVLAAYMAYARAYFYHRVVDKFRDMDVTGVGEFFQRDLSIFGTRPLVCTGYALLGAHLLKLAGAKLKTFIVAVRATEDDLANNTIDSGHAIAGMSRKGEDFFVSNDSIVSTKDDGIGPNAVAWRKSTADLIEASDKKSIPAANAALNTKLDKLGEQARKKRSKQKK
jgi:hypothetical protein